MDFSKLRHRIIFLKPVQDRVKNGMNENVPVWAPFQPVNGKLAEDIYVTEDDRAFGTLMADGGQLYSYNLAVSEYAVWANVSPASGREYEEAQKLRAETTYKISTRYFPCITSEMKILFGVQLLDIISVLNIGEMNSELQIVAKERDRYGKEY